MFPSTIASKFLRLGLLSVFCAGLFVSSWEVHLGSAGNGSLGNGVVYAVDATAPAATGWAAKTEDKKEPVDDTINAIISFLNLGVGILTFLITPLIMLAGWLLSPDWTFGEVFGLRPILHQLWVLVSNVVYVIFGFFLVFIAFANIFGGESAKAYEMKNMLPKLVTGMLMVPFTWFIVSATLSISNVLTASVIQLPVSTISKAGGDVNGLMTNKIIPKNITFNKDVNYGKDAWAGEGENKATAAGTANGNFLASDCDKNPNDCLSIKEFLSGGGGGAYNLLSVYAYGIFRIQGYKSITTEQKINKVIDIASKLGFWVIFFLVFGILVIAIVYALFSRALMLWLYAMFSPLFALNYVMDFKGKLKDSVGKLSVTKFISLAMVPVYVSAALAFGLMFLGLVMSATGTAAGDNWSLKSSVVEITPNGSATTFKFGGGDGITLTTIGLLDPESKSWVSKALDLGKGIIGTIIINVLALVLLWAAVMAALGADDITGAAVKPISDFGDQIGKLAVKLPQYIPIPVWGGKSTSMAGLWSIGENIGQAVRGMGMGDSVAIWQTFGKEIGKAMWLHTTEVTDAIEKLNTAYNRKNPGNINSNHAQKWAAMSEVLGSMGIPAEKAIQDSQIRGAILDKIEKAYHLEKETLDTLRDLSNVDQFNSAFKTIAGWEEGKKKGLDQLIDGTPWVLDSDKFSGIFQRTSSSSPSTTSSAIVDHFVADTGKTNTGKISVHIEDKPEIHIEVTNGAIKEEKVKEQLKANKVENSDIDNIIAKIKEELPKQTTGSGTGETTTPPTH